MKKLDNMDILLIVLLTIFCLVIVLVPILNKSFIRPIIGLLFILFLPGYSLIAALFPKRENLGNFELMTLSFGFSVVVSLLIGLGLTYTPYGIRLDTILISISLFTIFMLLIAFYRRKRVPVNERINLKIFKSINSIKASFKTVYKKDKIFTTIIIISIVLATFMSSYIVLSPKEGEKFTEFYILGPNHNVSNYPTKMTVNSTGNVIIGIINNEYAKTDYEIIVKLDNYVIKDENISLESNEKYEENFTFNAYNGSKKLEFLLYKLPDTVNAYRSLNLWINIG